MKGLAGSAGSVAVIALGLFPGASAESLRQEPAELEVTGVVHVAELPSTNALNGSHSRRLQRGRGRGRPRPRPPVINDDALDVNGTVSPDSFLMQKFPAQQAGTGLGGGVPAQFETKRCSMTVLCLQ